MPKPPILLLLLTFFAVGYSDAYSQNTRASVSGFITDASTGETLLAANVALLEINRGTTTNTLGYYSLTNLPSGDYTIAVSYIGYEVFRIPVRLENEQNLRLDISLQ